MQTSQDANRNAHYPDQVQASQPRYDPITGERINPVQPVDQPQPKLGEATKPIKPEPPRLLLVKKAGTKQNVNYFSRYPFADLAIGDGFFVANDDVKHDNIAFLRKEIFRARDFYSIVEHDENGDEISEEIHTKTRQTVNGKLAIDSGGDPIYGASQTLVPKRIYSRHFSAFEVAEGDDIGDGVKAPAAGVLVVREA